jgi:hypothetical protein
MEQLVLLVVIGLISLVNWVMQKAAEKREEAKTKRVGSREVKRETRRNVYTQPAPAPTARRAATERDPFKDLMDALGLPAETVLPPPVAPQTAPEQDEEEFASLEEAPPPLPRRSGPQAEAPRWQPASVRRPDKKTERLASAFASKEKAPAEKIHRGSVRELLTDSASKRHAIVLSEILGPPRGLAPFRTV